MEPSTNVVNIGKTAMQSLNASDIARSIASRINNADIQAQLLFIQGQYLFATSQGNQTTYKFVSPDSVRAAFLGEPVDSGFLPTNTTRWGTNARGEYIVQFYPPQKYSVSLNNLKNSQIIVLTVPMPAFVFVGCGSSYWLWAIKENQLLPDSQLFHAPLPNVMSSGSICFGSITASKCSALGIGQAWDVFWRTPFNSDAVQNKSKNAPDDVRSHLLKLHDKKSRKYPLLDLVSLRCNVDDAIKTINNI